MLDFDQSDLSIPMVPASALSRLALPLIALALNLFVSVGFPSSCSFRSTFTQDSASASLLARRVYTLVFNSRQKCPPSLFSKLPSFSSGDMVFISPTVQHHKNQWYNISYGMQNINANKKCGIRRSVGGNWNKNEQWRYETSLMTLRQAQCSQQLLHLLALIIRQIDTTDIIWLSKGKWGRKILLGTQQ